MMATALSHTTQQDENHETYCLIWLDASVNNSQENIQAQKQLRTSINHLITFEDDQQCLQYIESAPKNDRIVLIVSGRLGQFIVPKIVKYQQIVSIYVYCIDKAANEEWTKYFTKVKAVIVELDRLIHRIKTDQHKRKHTKIDESLPISIISSNGNNQEQSTTELAGDFLHSQLLIDCLIRMEPTIDEKNELISLCKQKFEGNSAPLRILGKFEKEYSFERSLWWYTRNSFLHEMLNKALRVQNIRLLFLFRFLIRDIEQHLTRKRCASPVRVYRAQMMSNNEVEVLKNSLGEFIAINSFLSTSVDREQARIFFSTEASDDVQRVFFEIDADPGLDNIRSFSDIHLDSFYPDEKEVLFMIGSIFRLENIARDKDKTLVIKMRLCSLNDHHLKPLFRHMQKRTYKEKTNLLDFSYTLEKMGKWDDAETYYRRFLKELSNDRPKDVACCYHGLGRIAEEKGDFESSLKWYNKSLDIKVQISKPDDFTIAKDYSSIGDIYAQKKDYANALQSHEKALAIYRRTFGDNHPDVAVCMANMGIIYDEQHNYLDALQLHQKALSIWEKHLPPNHPDLSSAHKNIGIVHRHLGQYDLALFHYSLSLKIYKKSLPSQHPSIASTFANIGVVYTEKCEYQQALPYLEKAVTVYRHSLSATHPKIIQI